MNRFASRIGPALIALTLLGLCLPMAAQAQQPTEPGTSFVVLLKGIYQPAVGVPELDLKEVKLSDGAYIRTQIYPVSGLPGTAGQALGTFYAKPEIGRCAYQLPGGTIAAVFTNVVNTDIMFGGQHFWVGSAELVIPEATGIYRAFVGGKIHMEFKTHLPDAATLDEYCICFVSR
jgi:hypothetical protein